MLNPWKILGVNRQMSQEEIHNAYIMLARKYHPDVGIDNGKFSVITGAYGLLKDREALAYFVAQQEIVGRSCTGCKGTGATFKARGLTERVATTCKTCEGSGIILKEKAL